MTGSQSVQRILVADDDQGVRKLLHNVLTAAGSSVELCETGRAALDRLKSETYSLLILDDLMPPPRGLDIIKELRGKGDRVPIILMSGTLDEEVLDICVGMDPIACISKPFGLEELRSVIEAVTYTKL